MKSRKFRTNLILAMMCAPILVVAYFAAAATFGFLPERQGPWPRYEEDKRQITPREWRRAQEMHLEACQHMFMTYCERLDGGQVKPSLEKWRAEWKEKTYRFAETGDGASGRLVYRSVKKKDPHDPQSPLVLDGQEQAVHPFIMANAPLFPLSQEGDWITLVVPIEGWPDLDGNGVRQPNDGLPAETRRHYLIKARTSWLSEMPREPLDF